MPITFPCPTCRQQLTLSDAAAGRRGKCPHCKGEIVVPAAGPAAAPAVPNLSLGSSPSLPAASPPPLPMAVPLGSAAGAPASAAPPAPPASPFMAGAASAPAPAPPLQPGGWSDVEPQIEGHEFRSGRVRGHHGVVVMVLGIVGIVIGLLSYFVFCCPFVGLPAGLVALGMSITAAVMGGLDLKKMGDGLMDVAGKPMTLAGFICGLVGSAVVIPSLFLSGAMTVAWISSPSYKTNRTTSPFLPVPTSPAPNFDD